MMTTAPIPATTITPVLDPPLEGGAGVSLTGAAVGRSVVGTSVGLLVAVVGLDVGSIVGLSEGLADGLVDGLVVGTVVGANVLHCPSTVSVLPPLQVWVAPTHSLEPLQSPSRQQPCSGPQAGHWEPPQSTSVSVESCSPLTQ